MLQNFGTALSREQMKLITGGLDDLQIVYCGSAAFCIADAESQQAGCLQNPDCSLTGIICSAPFGSCLG